MTTHTMDKEEQAKIQGRTAGRTGRGLTACPYLAGTKLRNIWFAEYNNALRRSAGFAVESPTP